MKGFHIETVVYPSHAKYRQGLESERRYDRYCDMMKGIVMESFYEWMKTEIRTFLNETVNFMTVGNKGVTLWLQLVHWY